MTMAEPPRFTVEQATAMARDAFGVEGDLGRLPGDRDQNFQVVRESEPRFIFKIVHPGEGLDRIAAQQAVLEHVAEAGLPYRCPRVIRPRSGVEVATFRSEDGTVYPLRLMTWVAGDIAADFVPRPFPDGLLTSIGDAMGRLSEALAGLTLPALEGPFTWDLVRAFDIVQERCDFIEGTRRRILLDTTIRSVHDRMSERWEGLRQSVVHNDANDYNLVVTDDRVSGLIDFGDVVRTVTVAEVGVAAAYALLEQPDPVHAAACVVEGYHRRFPLQASEAEVLFDLILARLCLSVSISAEQIALDPENQYLVVSEQPAWDAIEYLTSLPAEDVRTRLIEAAARE